MSTMLPISVARGANIISRASVARLMNFIVISGQRKTGTSARSAAFKKSLSARMLLLKTTQGIL